MARFILPILSLTFVTSIVHAADKPNVLFILVDDLRADCLGAFGHPQVKTPHLDTLVKSGMTMRNAYCMGSNVGAVCTPSRNMILSGQTYFRNWKNNLAPANGPNLPDAMKAAGYATYHHGKKANVARLINAKFDTHKTLDNDNAERTSGQPGRTITDAAIAYLKTRPADKPMLMMLEYEAPHDPRVAAKEYLDQYDRNAITLPKNFLPQHPWENGATVIRDEKLAPWPRTEAEIRKQLHEYYAVISGLDHHIGRLLDAVKESNLADNTIIIFAADHGLAMGSHGLMGKQSLYEHSMRAPLVVTGPGIVQGESVALVYLLDILPTICDLTGAKTPTDIDGKSFAPLLTDRKMEVHETLFTAYMATQRASAMTAGNSFVIRRSTRHNSST